MPYVVRLDKETHLKLKKAAANEGSTMKNIITDLINNNYTEDGKPATFRYVL